MSEKGLKQLEELKELTKEYSQLRKQNTINIINEFKEIWNAIQLLADKVEKLQEKIL